MQWIGDLYWPTGGRWVGAKVPLGNSGVEAAIDLAGIVGHVTLLEFGDQLRTDAVLVSNLKSLANVVVHTQRKPPKSPAPMAS